MRSEFVSLQTSREGEEGCHTRRKCDIEFQCKQGTPLARFTQITLHSL